MFGREKKAEKPHPATIWNYQSLLKNNMPVLATVIAANDTSLTAETAKEKATQVIRGAYKAAAEEVANNYHNEALVPYACAVGALAMLASPGYLTILFPFVFPSAARLFVDLYSASILTDKRCNKEITGEPLPKQRGDEAVYENAQERIVKFIQRAQLGIAPPSA